MQTRYRSPRRSSAASHLPTSPRDRITEQNADWNIREIWHCRGKRFGRHRNRISSPTVPRHPAPTMAPVQDAALSSRAPSTDGHQAPAASAPASDMPRCTCGNLRTYRATATSPIVILKNNSPCSARWRF